MKITRWTIFAALLLASTSVAHAQAPVEGAMTAPGGATAGATGATADSGSISNAQSTETVTTTSSSGIGPDGVSMTGGDAMMGDSNQLANTGGEPVLMSLLGLSMALGAFAVRKRVSA